MNEQDFFKWLGGKIQQFRKDAKMTQEELCDKIFMDTDIKLWQSDLSSFESQGKRIQNAFTINAIIMATGRTWKDLFRESSDPEKKTPKFRSAYRPFQTATAGAI
jgi:transcriptional regulator with XRE-family HTH domain